MWNFDREILKSKQRGFIKFDYYIKQFATVSVETIIFSALRKNNVLSDGNNKKASGGGRMVSVRSFAKKKTVV